MPRTCLFLGPDQETSLSHPSILFGVAQGESNRISTSHICHSGPEDLYDIINERYERGSILPTSNRAPGEWPDLFGDPLLASAGLDRLTHRAHIIAITRASFRPQAPKWELPIGVTK